MSIKILHVIANAVRRGEPGLVVRQGASVQRGTMFNISCPQCSAHVGQFIQKRNPMPFGARAYIEILGEVTPCDESGTK
jgi:hypothetical protein